MHSRHSPVVKGKIVKSISIMLNRLEQARVFGIKEMIFENV